MPEVATCSDVETLRCSSCTCLPEMGSGACKGVSVAVQAIHFIFWIARGVGLTQGGRIL